MLLVSDESTLSDVHGASEVDAHSCGKSGSFVVEVLLVLSETMGTEDWGT